jgi:NTP pyrophosphatase (non-canonical NTP hydrolase)|nr:MAG TPA: nucleoside triphosphate pyrophosphohydrolase [Caudoviricetes sp.]
MITSKEYIEARNEEMARFMLAHYGLKAQKMIEELSELIQALAKDDINAIKEEVADVEVMLMQIKDGMHIETAEIMNYKLNRQKARIENAKRK